MAISKQRQEMGEEKWAEYQRERNRRKTKTFQRKHPERYVNYRSNVKQQLIEYKGGKCEICGYDKDCPPAYSFHHLDPDEKDFSVASRSMGFETAKLEVDKCQLLCVCCHAEVHYKDYEQIKAETVKSLVGGS